MLKAFSTAATGMAAQQTIVDVTANNLANINTTGFKRSNVDFQDLLYVKMREAGAELFTGTKSPSGIEIGSGVRVVSTSKVFSPGELVNTGKSLDIAITGDGFLQVAMPDGSTAYTRDGALHRGPNGEILTPAGLQLSPPITIPTDVADVTIGRDGGVNITSSTGDQSIVGTIQLARFANPAGLSNIGDNLLVATEASGAASQGNPGDSGFGTLQGGFLEKSNVQMITELVNLITSQRAYEVSSRTIRAGDEMLQKAIQIARF